MVDEICANCGDKIGKLQTAYIFNDKIVCHKCNLILKAESSVSEIKSSSPPPPHVAHSSDLRKIKETTSEFAGLIKMILWLGISVFALILVGGIIAAIIGS